MKESMQCYRCSSVVEEHELVVVNDEEVCPYCQYDDFGPVDYRMTSVEYWRRRALRAEEYIRESPCDPDITTEQKEAWMRWKEVI